MEKNNGISKIGADLWIALFLMIFSGVVINEAFHLEIGTPANPGSGFVIFGTSLVLGILALIQFFRALLFQKKNKKLEEKIILWRIVTVIGANFLYVAILETAGFLLCTFFLLCFLFQVYEKSNWIYTVGGAAVTSLLTYVLFSKLLQLHLPQGLIYFF